MSVGAHRLSDAERCRRAVSAQEYRRGARRRCRRGGRRPAAASAEELQSPRLYTSDCKHTNTVRATGNQLTHFNTLFKCWFNHK